MTIFSITEPEPKRLFYVIISRIEKDNRFLVTLGLTGQGNAPSYAILSRKKTRVIVILWFGFPNSSYLFFLETK